MREGKRARIGTVKRWLAFVVAGLCCSVGAVTAQERPVRLDAAVHALSSHSSGLVQIACTACGIGCPGDSDLQEAALGTTLPDGTPPQRGDLLFWKGHVAWVAGPDTLVHANAHHMAVALEALQGAINRIAAQGDGPVTRHARL